MFKRTEMGFCVPLHPNSNYLDLHEMAEELSKLIPNGKVYIEASKSDSCMVLIDIEDPAHD